MSSIKVLKNLKAIYWRALDSKKWDIALQTVDRQARYKAMFEKQSSPAQPLTDIRRMRDMTEEQLREVMAAWKKLYPDREHPPPLAPQCP
ncbi:MAG: hypothetical protein K0R76_1414 [Alphaproteobacteria bacterium]|nr:hypothetical protein [Alphaproteobacteria bacterium]